MRGEGRREGERSFLMGDIWLNRVASDNILIISAVK
jgi:hypothetical protein